jgi:phosphoserine phosphatase
MVFMVPASEKSALAQSPRESYAESLSAASGFRQHGRVTHSTAGNPSSAQGMAAKVPLCVDLDGTLLNRDLFWESLKDIARKQPLLTLLFPIWLLRGRACLKQQVARHANLDVAALPYHHGFVEFLQTEKASGAKLILATASDRALAEKIATRFGLFDGVLASDGRLNLRGAAKGRLLASRYGEKGFDYAGNSVVDLAVWVKARRAIVVNGSESLVAKARSVAEVYRVFPEEPWNPCRTPW